MIKAEASDVEEIVKRLEVDLANNLLKYDVISKKLRDEICTELLGSKKIESTVEKLSGIKYNFNLSNTNVNLEQLTKKLKKAWNKKKPFSMLLYGVSGSGKSFYAKYLSQELNLNFLKKKASDLISKMVGETEKNIQAAFNEAKEKEAILVLDEADSFLYDRVFAKQDFQVATVNELLVQMESFNYPFICTTNLIDKIDNASFRRFVFKVKFDFLPKEKIKNAVKYFFNKSISENKLAKYDCITAGDLFNVKRKLDILCDDKITSEDILSSLLEEIELKPDYKSKVKPKIGF